MNATGSDPDKHRGWLHKTPRLLSAPLLITIVGAVIAGYLIPRIAAQTEDHRKALEIQASLVQDMSDAVARVVTVGQLIATRSIQKEGTNTNVAFNDALLEWASDRASIEARLEAYFGNVPVPERQGIDNAGLIDVWREYVVAVDNLYYLSSTELSRRCRRAQLLKNYIGDGFEAPKCRNPELTGEEQGADCKNAPTQVDALSLCDEDSEEKGYVRGQNFFDAYTNVSNELLRREDDLLDVVRTTTPAGF